MARPRIWQQWAVTPASSAQRLAADQTVPLPAAAAQPDPDLSHDDLTPHLAQQSTTQHAAPLGARCDSACDSLSPPTFAILSVLPFTTRHRPASQIDDNQHSPYTRILPRNRRHQLPPACVRISPAPNPSRNATPFPPRPLPEQVPMTSYRMAQRRG